MLTTEERNALQILKSSPLGFTALVASGVSAQLIAALEHLGLLEKVSLGGPPNFRVKPTYDLTPEGRLRLNGEKSTFLRLGHWCSCGFSWNDHTKNLENGISAFECFEVGQKQYLPDLDPAWRNDAKSFREQAAKVGTPWFLVAGTRIGIGGDGEPLLKDVEFKEVLVESGGSFVSSSIPAGKVIGKTATHQACGGSACP